MSANFVRYSPEVETFDPKLSEYMTRIIEVRRTLNHQPQREPASADEVLAWPKLDGQAETDPK